MWSVLSIIALFATHHATTNSSAPSATHWGWFRGSSTGQVWWITSGQGDVTITGRKFEAVLRDSADASFVRLSLRGTIDGTLVKATVSVKAADTGPFNVTGRLKRFCDPESGGGGEILILSNGIGVIGLTRDLDRSTPCKPTS